MLITFLQGTLRFECLITFIVRDVALKFVSLTNLRPNEEVGREERERRTQDEAVEDNVRRLLSISAASKVTAAAEKVIVRDEDKKKRTTAGKKRGIKKKRDYKTKGESTVFTDADFAAVGEFLKTELVKKQF
jgi:hypothetical protein